MSTYGKLHLFPSPIAEDDISNIPRHVLDKMVQVHYIVTERIRTTRRFLKKVKPDLDISRITFIEMDKHGDGLDQTFIAWCKAGHEVGLFSEAGIPCVADPGFRYVTLAHQHNILVAPYTGPSSILLALMSSGFTGQHFEFHGYLPRDKQDLKNSLVRLEESTRKSGKTHIFIETPYRNRQMIDQMMQCLNAQTHVCIATNLNNADEMILRTQVKDLKKIRAYFEEKKPAIFIIGNGKG